MKEQEGYEELLAELHRQEQNAVGFDSDQIAADQIEAFERYVGGAYGDEQLGRSQVHTREVFETIEWLRPDIARMFGAGGKAVEIEPWAQGSEQTAEDATDFLNLTFFEQQDGHAIVDTFFFDGALQKIGVVGVFWEEATLDEPEEYEGVDMMQAQQLAEDPNVDVLESEEIPPANQGPYTERAEAFLGGASTDLPTYRMKIQRVKVQARPYAKPIAPEDFRISPRAVSLDDTPYCGHVDRTTRSELKILFPDKLDEIEEYADSSREGVEEDERRQARFFDDDGNMSFPNREEDDDILLHTEYLYFDKDGDGYAELIEVKRLDGCILSCEPVEENPYACWSPIRIPHKLIGLSIADITKDIQRTKTVLLRAALDSAYQAVAPRVIANEKSVNLADLLTVRPGGIIRVKEGTDVRQAVQPMVVPDMAQSALQMMEHVDQMAEARSGVTRHAQGLDPDSLNKTATGIKLMQNAASVRKEMVARNFASGLEMMFRKFYRLLVRQNERPQVLRVGKEWKTFTPSTWEAEAKVRVHVGQGTGDREAQIGQLSLLLTMQREFVGNFGMQNPIVTPKHLHHTVEQIGRVMGFRSVDPFFADPAALPPEQMQALMAPKPSPEMAKVEAQKEADQAKLQLQAQSDQVQNQLDIQKMQMEMELKREQLQAELMLKREQLVAEMELKREIEAHKMARGFYDKPEPGTGRPNGSGNGSSVSLGGDPG